MVSSHQLSITSHIVHSQHPLNPFKHGVLTVAPLGKEVQITVVGQVLDGGGGGCVTGGDTFRPIAQVPGLEGEGRGVVLMCECKLGIVEQEAVAQAPAT